MINLIVLKQKIKCPPPRVPQCGAVFEHTKQLLSSEEIIRNNYVQKKENTQSPSTEQRCLEKDKKSRRIWYPTTSSKPLNTQAEAHFGHECWQHAMPHLPSSGTPSLSGTDGWWQRHRWPPRDLNPPHPNTTPAHSAEEAEHRDTSAREGRARNFIYAAQYSHSHLSWDYIERDPNVCSV